MLSDRDTFSYPGCNFLDDSKGGELLEEKCPVKPRDLFWVCSAPSLAINLDLTAMHTTMPQAPHAPWAAAFGRLLSHGYSWDTNLWLGILSLSFSQALLSCRVMGDSMSLCAYTHLDDVLHYFSFFVLHWSNSTVAAELCAVPGPVWKTDDSIFFFPSKDAIIFLFVQNSSFLKSQSTHFIYCVRFSWVFLYSTQCF